MNNQTDKNIIKPIQQTTMSVNIDNHMKRKRDMRGKNFDISKIKKFPALSFVLVTDPVSFSRVFGWVSFEGVSFVYYEESIQEIPSEKGIDIGYRMNFEQHEMVHVTQEYINNLTQDELTGAIFTEVHALINEFSKERWKVELDSLLTTLNAMMILGLVENDEHKLCSLDESRDIAKTASKESIKRAAWLALRMREARYLIERELIAIDTQS